jgi:hypothetical protein
MKSIFKLLDENKKEAIKILSSKENNTFHFATWDDELSCYIPYGYNKDEYDDPEEWNDICPDVCPWVRYADDDGNITALMVVAVRYNKKRIEITTTESPTEKSDDIFFNITWCDDISYWSVFDKLEDI